MAKVSSNTGKKQDGRGRSEGSKATQLKKGYDPRRNMKGRPKAFDQLRALALDILQSDATNKDGATFKWNGTEISFAEFILLGWALDKKQQEKIMEIAFGKVPTDINLSNPDGSLKPDALNDEERRKRMQELAITIAQEIKKDA